MNALAPTTTSYDPRENGLRSGPDRRFTTWPEELRNNVKSQSPHQAEMPWERTPPASASAALLELGAKIFTAEEKKRLQKVEDSLLAIDKQWAAHCDPVLIDQKIWDLEHDTSENLSVEEKVEKRKALEAEKADMPTWRQQLDDKQQRNIREFLPFAKRLLEALAERIGYEIEDIMKNGVGGRNDYWQIGGADKNHFLFPLLRLADYTVSHIQMCERYDPQNGWLLRSRLIDCGAIKERAKLTRG